MTLQKSFLQTDSSRSGLGPTLLQEGKPIAYASKSLTSSKKNYAQIELECLGILFGLKRYHHWVYGRKVIVETDHLSLIPIFKKPLYLCPARLQRMMIQMQRYNIELRFRAGKDIPVQDTLSRKSVSDTCPSLSELWMYRSTWSSQICLLVTENCRKLNAKLSRMSN